MSTTPPPDEPLTTAIAPPPPEPPSFHVPGVPPTPGNAEFPVYLGASVVVAILVGTTEAVSWGDFVFSYTLITLAYIVSRGIAKASRVYER
jgi:hypothetical protein